jgi:hypothetical protein
MRPSLALVVTLGCSSVETNATPDPIVDLGPGPTAAPAPTTTTLTRREDAPPSKLDAWSLPNLKGPKLGEPCPARDTDAERPRRGPEPCGTGGKVSIEYDGYRPLRGGRPCAMHRLGSDERRALYQSSACVDGDHLVLSSDCLVCRTTSGWSAHARLSELTPDQHAQIFERLGYGEGKQGPSSPAGWKRLVENAPLERPDDAGP